MQAELADTSPRHGGRPVVSCLCVTERRPAFLPWLLWNYHKQDYALRELVVVSGDDEAGLRGAPGVTLVRSEPSARVARKRNLAVAAARGDIVAWLDDDDWQHPRRLSILAGALSGGAVLAGSTRSWFVDLARGRARAHASHRGNVIFNGLGVRRDALAGVRFDERRARAADTAWLAQVRRASGRPPLALAQVLSFWLCHRTNVSNPTASHVFTQPIGAVREALGPAAWGDTDAHLAQLRGRLGVSA